MSNDQLEPSGPIFTYSFTAHTLSTAGPSDVFTVTASTASRVSVRGFASPSFRSSVMRQPNCCRCSF